MKLFITCLSFLCIFVSCKKIIGIPDNFDYGKIEKNVYQNEFFGMHWPINDGWESLDRGYVDSLRAEGLKDMVGDNEQLEKTITAADIKTANLLSIIHVDTVEVQMYSPNISMMAENLALNIQIKNGQDYLEEAKKFMQGSGVNFEFVGDIHQFNIDGKEFFTMEVINLVQGVPIHQDFYATVINGFGLALVGSWMDKKQRVIIQQSLATIQFD